MNYTETLEYLYSHLPMFSRIGTQAIKKDLTNTLELCRRLHNPEQKFKSIHVAGTNGKGSTSHMLAAILQTAGYKTGLYTSPHLKDFRERIRINGKMITRQDVTRFVKEQKKNIEEIEPSFFEVTVAMAFDYFANSQVDIAVIEVGLGGRLDSTNVITPLLSVITNIGYDHMNILGDTLPEIASEKAGIIKPGIPAIIGERQAAIADVFIRKARETGSVLTFASDEWVISLKSEVGSRESGVQSPESGVGSWELGVGSLNRFLNLNAKPVIQSSNHLINQLPNHQISQSPNHLIINLDLTGTYQIRNLSTVLSAVEQLRRQGWQISDKHIQTALKQVKTLTGLRGRWDVLSRNPLIICDTGHNEDGIKEVLKNIGLTTYKHLHMVIGMVRDKDIHKILVLLPKEAIYYFCHPKLERAKPADELSSEAKGFNLHGEIYSSVQNALHAAKQNAGINDLIFVGGSTFVVAEVV